MGGVYPYPHPPRRRGGGGGSAKNYPIFINYVIYVSYAVKYAVSYDPYFKIHKLPYF